MQGFVALAAASKLFALFVVLLLLVHRAL